MEIGDESWDTTMAIELPERVQIRQFIFNTDLQRVLELWTLSAPGVQLSNSDHPNEIKKKLKRDPDLFLVAEQDDKLIGAVLGGFDGRRGIIYHLAVNSKNRGEGVGKALMKELEKRLRSKGCLKYYLLVTKDNPAALEFYRKLGCNDMEMYVLGKELK